MPRGDNLRGEGQHWSPDTEWKPGQSGNPGGRPSVRGLRDALRKEFGDDDTLIAKQLKGIIDGTMEGFRGGDVISAIRLYCEYMYGKPMQPMEATGDITITVRYEDGDSN
jgi:hypothetical protein